MFNLGWLFQDLGKYQDDSGNHVSNDTAGSRQNVFNINLHKCVARMFVQNLKKYWIHTKQGVFFLVELVYLFWSCPCVTLLCNIAKVLSHSGEFQV